MNFSDIIKTGQQFAQKAAQPKRPAGGVRRRNEARGQFKNRMPTRSQNIANAKATGMFDKIRDEFNKQNDRQGGSWMSEEGSIYTTDAKGEIDYDALKKHGFSWEKRDDVLNEASAPRDWRQIQNPASKIGGQSDNSDITELFKGIQQTRTRVHKDTSGNIIDPDAPKGLDKLYADNPHLKPSAGLQAQNNWQARDAAGAAAVARKKAEQEAARNPYGNVVTAPNGSRGVTNSMGQIVGTTAPVGDGSKRVFDDATGKMVPMDQWFADRNVVQQSKGMTPSPVAQAWNTAQNTKPDSMDLLFSGKPQSSPPGGAQAGMVGPPAPQGAPGGDPPRDWGRMPDVQGERMQMMQPVQKKVSGQVKTPSIEYGPRQPVQQTGWDAFMEPNSGSQLPALSPEQLSAFKALDARGFPARVAQETPQAPSRFRMGLTNYFPGNDYDYLQQTFPGKSIDQILQLFPAYANQFR